MRTVLVTGVAGFVGAAVAKRMLADGWRVVGLDSVNDYYDVKLKKARVADVKRVARKQSKDSFTFIKADLVKRDKLLKIMDEFKPEVVVHLAAQASVRYGLVNQDAYLNSNLIGHFNVLMACKAGKQAGYLKHLLYASSSSVYGHIPADGVCREEAKVDKPVSLYAASKVADEVISHAWQVQFGVPCTGLRFFTVYGPWGRPDMTPVMFAEKMLAGETIPLFNGGDLWRDFTFIDDIVEGVVGLVKRGPQQEAEVFNLGNQNPVRMTEFVATLGEVLGVTPKVDNLPWPPTEVYRTCADTSKLRAAIGWAPATPLKDGLTAMAKWYRKYKKV